MRIGIRAHDMEAVPLEVLAQNIYNKGFLCTQLALNKAIHNININPEAMTPGMACYIKDVFQTNKVDIAVLGCYLNIGNPDSFLLNQIMETYKTHIRFARLLECGMVGTETGAMNIKYTYDEANHTKNALYIFIENLKRVVEYGEKMGVIIGIEPVYKHIVCNIERTELVMKTINSLNLQIIFDPVNLLSIDNYKEQQEIITGAFQLFGKDIAVIHAKDFLIEGNTLTAVPAGQGCLDYELLMGLIKKNKPYIHVLLENTSPDIAIKTREFVQQIYQNIT